MSTCPSNSSCPSNTLLESTEPGCDWMVASVASLARLFSGPVIDIFVGPTKVQWRVHEELLCHYSPFFRAALRGNFKEAKDKSITLPEDDSFVFRFLVLYMYRGSLPEFQLNIMTKRSNLSIYLELYFLADKLSLESLQNKIIDQLRQGFANRSRIPAPSSICRIYERTAPGSKLRQWAVQIALREMLNTGAADPTAQYEECFDMSGDFGRDVAQYIIVDAIRPAGVRVKKPEPMRGTNCEFHVHIDGKLWGGARENALEVL
ncbi:MAG: hypothetical protein M1833_001924 [Piccolia ochrophora]|nr:MAG: hypothetical protein M1833_001924 [Piccolia ochrophora]